MKPLTLDQTCSIALTCVKKPIVSILGHSASIKCRPTIDLKYLIIMLYHILLYVNVLIKQFKLFFFLIGKCLSLYVSYIPKENYRPTSGKTT